MGEQAQGWKIINRVCLCLWVDWLVLCRINDFFPLDVLIWNGPILSQIGHVIDSSRVVICWYSSQVCVSCLQRVRDVDYLLIAKLVATSTLENPPWLGNFLCWLQVVLSEDHNFCCFKQKAMRLNDVRSGNKAVYICGPRYSIQNCQMDFIDWTIQFREWTPAKKGGSSCRVFGVQWKVVTWLILPVVICLSQRLSHACLSINKFVLWNCEWLIKSVIVYLMLNCYMDNCGNSRANTCNQAPTSGRGVFIR
jgi:hypothetical protein